MTLRARHEPRSASLFRAHAPLVLALIAGTACTASSSDSSPGPHPDSQLDGGPRPPAPAGEDEETAPEGAGANDPSILLRDPEMTAEERARYAVDPSALL